MVGTGSSRCDKLDAPFVDSSGIFRGEEGVSVRNSLTKAEGRGGSIALFCRNVDAFLVVGSRALKARGNNESGEGQFIVWETVHPRKERIMQRKSGGL